MTDWLEEADRLERRLGQDSLASPMKLKGILWKRRRELIAAAMRDAHSKGYWYEDRYKDMRWSLGTEVDNLRTLLRRVESVLSTIEKDEYLNGGTMGHAGARSVVNHLLEELAKALRTDV